MGKGARYLNYIKLLLLNLFTLAISDSQLEEFEILTNMCIYIPISRAQFITSTINKWMDGHWTYKQLCQEHYLNNYSLTFNLFLEWGKMFKYVMNSPTPDRLGYKESLDLVWLTVQFWNQNCLDFLLMAGDIDSVLVLQNQSWDIPLFCEVI